MRKNIYLLLFLATSFCFSQTMTQNYVKSTMYRSAYTGYQITLDTTGTAVPPVTVINDTMKRVSISYFDGLGRPNHKIDYQQSTSLRDIVTYYEFDGLGRQPKDYLPYVRSSSSLGHVPHPRNETYDFYNDPVGSGIENSFAEATANPFSEKKITNSPLNEVIKVAAPGNSWAMDTGHEVKFENRYNAYHEVRFFSAVSDYNPTLEVYNTNLNSQISYYSVGQLNKSTSWDENNSSGSTINTQEFKDKLGRVILKRVGTEIGYNDTYYVYDQFGNLSFVIPPLVDTSGAISQNDLNNICYQYLYDNENRLIEKKLPGKGWEYIVYDKLNRVVATGPAFNPFGGSETGWLVTKYDPIDRVVYTGWLAASDFSSEVRTLYKIEIYTNEDESEHKSDEVSTIDDVSLSYTNNVYPTNDLMLLTINYYDDYYYIYAPTPPSTILMQSTIKTPQTLLTGSWVRVLEKLGEVKNEFSYNVYDLKGRIIRTHKTNYFGGYTYMDSKLDFLGKALYTHTYHRRSEIDTELFIKNNFTYSIQDRLVLHKQQINDLPEELIVKNTYDEIGQLISKNVGGNDVSGNTGLQKVDYSYTIRGWLKGINDVNDIALENDLFALKLNYNSYDQTGSNDVAPNLLYNGNISSTYWITGTDNTIRKYNYSYDSLNRLLDANYIKPQVNTSVNSYKESLTYDKNGNIQTLKRNGDLDAANFAIEVDDLTYTYNPNNQNQLVQVRDATNHPFGFKDDSLLNDSDDYSYDDNGNLISDANKSIGQIIYNHLNLPTSINFLDATKNIDYIYNALGEKLKKTVNNGSQSGYIVDTTDYLDGMQYTNDKLSIIPHAEGYVNVRHKYISTFFNYVFNYTDHLGNVRVSYSDPSGNNEPQIMEENHYYPFGLKHTKYNSDSYQFELDGNGGSFVSGIELIPPGARSLYQYKYNGKEYQDELGLNLYDYGFRNYMPDLGRWFNIDPLAESYYDTSTYTYVKNSPITTIDPDGRYLFGLFGSSSSERRIARAEKFAEKVGGSVHNRESGRPSVNYNVGGTSDGGMSMTTKSNFGDFSSWKNFKQTLSGFDKASQGSGGNEYTGVKGMRDFGEDLGSASNVVKTTGVVVTASSVALGPEMVPIGVGIYNAGGTMDDASTLLQINADVAQGKGVQALTRGISAGIGKVTDNVIDNNVSGSVSQTILKHRADAYIGVGRDKIIENLDKKGNK